jgi:L-threonylcarbamoyladenylate synthase
MAYRHYAPHAPVTVVTGDPERSSAYIRQRVTPDTGVICFDEYAPLFKGLQVECLGSVKDKAAQAHRVFEALRAFDHTEVREIMAQCPDSAGLGLAVENRLKKAAGFHVVEAV